MVRKINIKSNSLIKSVKELIENSKTRIAVAVNSELALLYWDIGNLISKEIIIKVRADYGKSVIQNLSNYLTNEFGQGWSEKHLWHCLRSAETFTKKQILYAVRRQLSWTHIKIIMYEEDKTKRAFYLEMAIAERWSTRILQDKMNKMLYERTAISKKPQRLIKKEISNMAVNSQVSPDIIFKDSYVLDFLGLKNSYKEKDLEPAILYHIQSFILELGQGFAFIERQKRITIDNIDYHIDLLFYHRILNRLIVIELKLGKFLPEYKGQMELYLRWLEKYEMEVNEEKPIGLILCSEGNTEHIELLMLDEETIRVAQYLTKLPSKKWFAQKLQKAIKIAKMNKNEKQIKN